MSGKMYVSDIKKLHDSLLALNDLRKDLGLDIGVYQSPDIKISDDGIQLRLVWDRELNEYYVEEQLT